MAPKSNSGKDKLIGDEDDVLQAVILADSFNKRFRPLTAHKPRCLLPICNAPLLDWTFESLALAGVQEIFVICRSHAELIKAAINESKWSRPGSGIKIVPIMTAKETFSPGDAMRDIYTRGLVTSDFVLVMGDLVSNIRIDEVVRVHKERRKTNKDAIMTMVVMESGVQHRTRSRGESSVFVLDAETSECLHYEPVMGHPRTKMARIPREILGAHPEVEIRNDFIDCSIDVCSVEVPSLFQDNFDYGDIRKDFVHGVLTSDLLMKNIYCYVAKDGYAARVQDTKSYGSISKDILSRWTFPLVPDDNHPGGHVYEHNRGNKYIAKDNTVVLSRTCKIGNNTLIGSNTQVYDSAQIIASVIGRDCIIGPGAIIRDSYIFDGTVIGSRSTVEQSIIGAGVIIKENCILERGCLVADGVILGPGAKLEPFERLSRSSSDALGGDESDVDSDLEDVEANQGSIFAVLGPDSNAIVWPRGPPEEDSDEEGADSYNNLRFMRLGDDASDLDVSDAGSNSSEEDNESSEDEDVRPLAALSTGTEFISEVNQSIQRAFAEGHSVDNAAVELKTLRMASDVLLVRVREAVIAAIVAHIPIVQGNSAQQKLEIERVVGRWGELINKIGGIDGVETVTILQTYCASSERLPLFGQILVALYNEDIIDDENIKEWHRLPSSQGIPTDKNAENMKKCWTTGGQMVQYLENDSGEEDSEEESEEEEKPVQARSAAKHSAEEEEDSEEEELSEEGSSEGEDKSGGSGLEGSDENSESDEQDSGEDKSAEESSGEEDSRDSKSADVRAEPSNALNAESTSIAGQAKVSPAESTNIAGPLKAELTSMVGPSKAAPTSIVNSGPSTSKVLKTESTNEQDAGENKSGQESLSEEDSESGDSDEDSDDSEEENTGDSEHIGQSKVSKTEPTSISAQSKVLTAEPTGIAARAAASKAEPTSISAQSKVLTAEPTGIAARAAASKAEPTSISAQSKVLMAESTGTAARAAASKADLTSNVGQAKLPKAQSTSIVGTAKAEPTDEQDSGKLKSEESSSEEDSGVSEDENSDDSVSK